MVMLDDIRIHGLEARYAGGGVMVSYVYPGAVEVRLGVGMTMPAADQGKEQWIDLGISVGDPDEQDPREDRFWQWEAATKPATRIWARHVMAVDARVDHPERRAAGGPTSLTYEFEGEVVLLWGFVPTRADELELMAAGFQPSLATWRAPATPETRAVAARKAQIAPVPDSATHREPGAPPPPIAAVLAEAHGEWVQHAWMRWAALMGTSGLQVGPHRFEFMRPAQADGTTLVLRYRKGKDDLRVALDVARHPLIYDVTVSMGARGSAQHLGIPRSERVFPGVAWEDFPTLVAAIEPFVTVGPIRPAAPAKTDEPPPLAPRPAPPAAKTTRAGRRSKSIDPSIPRPVTPTSPSWIDAVLDHFNRTPGPRLAVQRQRANGAVFVVHPEGTTPDRALASIDVLAEQIDEIRWLDHTLRVPQQEAILGRMEQALDAAADEPEDGRPSPLEALITMMRNRGLMQLGVDVEASPKLDRTDGYRPLAEALRDLAEPSGITPIELQAYLERSDLMAVAEVVGRALGADPPPLRALMSALWDALDEDLPLVKLRQPGPTIRIPEDCLFEDHGPTALLLVVGDRRRLRRVKVRVLERPEDSDQVLVEDTTDSLEPGDAIHHHTRSIDVLFELHAKLHEFEATLTRAPQALEDVRRLLYWSAAMIDAPRCQGDLKAATHKSFQLARSYYEIARKRLIEGRTGDAVRQMHEALRRISSAAAELAMNCAEGQLTITPSSPPNTVRPEDAAAIESA
jgi:hypothetical protein